MRWLLQVAAVAWLNLLLLVGASSLPELRIQPLGDSITKGALSSHGNGYRGYLRDMLTEESDKEVDMVGSLRFGNMSDNDHEGHSGHFLREIGEFYKRSIRTRPNVVLIHAGINNMDKEIDVDESPELMEKLIDGVHDEAPDAAILVMPIIWANDTRLQNNTDHFNRILSGIIKKRRDDDMHIYSVSTHMTVADLADFKHPNDQGYEKMANAWFRGIKEVNERGWLKDPVEVNAEELPRMGLGTRLDSGGDDENEDEDEGEDGDDDSGASRPLGTFGSNDTLGLLRRAAMAACMVWSLI